MKNTIKLATTLVLFSSVLGSVTTFAAGEDNDTATTTGKIKFTKGGGEIKPPVDPEQKPSEPIEPGEEPGGNGGTENGPLAIVFAPNFDFGEQKVSTDEKLYSAALQSVTGIDSGKTKNTANFVEIADERGTMAGWNLKVSNSDFVGTVDATRTLDGAEIVFNDGVIVAGVPDKAATGFEGEFVVGKDAQKQLITAAKDTGMNRTTLRFGSLGEDFDTLEEGEEKEARREAAAKAVQLKVPSTALQYAEETYTSTITWSLEDTPENPEA